MLPLIGTRFPTNPTIRLVRDPQAYARHVTVGARAGRRRRRRNAQPADVGVVDEPVVVEDRFGGDEGGRGWIGG